MGILGAGVVICVVEKGWVHSARRDRKAGKAKANVTA